MNYTWSIILLIRFFCEFIIFYKFEFDHFRDIGNENNVYGVAIVRDECVFPSNKVECVGQIIGAIIAKDQDTALKASRKVNKQIVY